MSIPKRLFDWFAIRMSRSISVDGLWIGVFVEEPQKEVLDRLREAVLLIKTYDPHRYKRVLREAERIWAQLLPGPQAVWVHELKRCIIDPRFILSSRPEFVASTIVHEVTHGRLMRYEVPYFEGLRHRVEGICYRQELAFASKIPNGDELKQDIERRLELGVAPEFWTDQALREWINGGEVEMARHAGIPDWLFARTGWIRRIFNRVSAASLKGRDTSQKDLRAKPR